MQAEKRRSFWRTPNGLAAIGLIVAVSYFLLTEHLAHTIYFLPFAIFLLCPLMHVFMHGGHGHGGHGHGEERSEHDHHQDGGPGDAR